MLRQKIREREDARTIERSKLYVDSRQCRPGEHGMGKAPIENRHQMLIRRRMERKQVH